MPYKEICNLCEGNGYIKIRVNGKKEIKQCWECASEGEIKYSQSQIDSVIYDTYFKK
tara:strand:- start:449 stop:619 length:171 start_codon:yes stop_codon:yes gene_type:complete